MTSKPRMYVAGTGMITSIGATTVMTAAAAKAGISRYQNSSYYTQQTRQAITMAGVPDEVFSDNKFNIDEGSYYSGQYDHIIKMAIIAIRETLSGHTIAKPIPLILAMPEVMPSVTYIRPDALLNNLLRHTDLPLQSDMIERIQTGRAAAIQGLELAQHYLNNPEHHFVLLGGSDSYLNAIRIKALDSTGRALALDVRDGFVPGEGAGFLLLTSKTENAINKDGHIISVHSPGIAQEPGHMYSDDTYLGNGLDEAFKLALKGHTGESINTVYSSMNGESHWSKEYGVAMMRHKPCFSENIETLHPAEYFGDIGSATSSVLMGLAAVNLLNTPEQNTGFVYSSSDSAYRAAVRLEKIICD